jgi:hypothetical protein
MKILADNPRARVAEVSFEPGVRRESYVRPTDQIVVFLDDCAFDAIDAGTAAIRHIVRRSGEIVWHEKGELAPVLINTGERRYRTLLIELKDQNG